MAYYSVQAASKITGISDACIRAWEKRYNSVSPTRNGSNHRLYSDADIERLTLFNKLTSIGMKISQLSQLQTDELKKIFCSITKKDFGKNAVETHKSKNTFFQSLYIIEESFNARRFEVAYHEVNKVINESDIKELALSFIPSLEGICNVWKEKLTIEKDEITAFEKFIKNVSFKKSLGEKDYLRDVKSITISLKSNKNQLSDSGLDLLLAGYRIENAMYLNETSLSFVSNMAKTIKPNLIFIVSDYEDAEVIDFIENAVSNEHTKIVVYNQTLPLLDKSSLAGNTTSYNSILELDKFLDLYCKRRGNNETI